MCVWIGAMALSSLGVVNAWGELVYAFMTPADVCHSREAPIERWFQGRRALWLLLIKGSATAGPLPFYFQVEGNA